MSRSQEKRALRARSFGLTAWLLVALLSACGGDSTARMGDDDAGDDLPNEDAGRDSGQGSDAGGDAGDAGSDAGTNANAPVLTAVQARQVGRTGADLRVDVTGSDTNKDIATVQLSIFDTTQTIIGAEHVVALATPITMTMGSSYVVLTDALKEIAGFKSVKVTLVDAKDLRSGTLETDIAVQPVLAENDACDETFVLNRCPDTFGCKGTTKKCLPGEVPVLTKVAYMMDEELGRRVLITGSDPDGDPRKYTINFLDQSGMPLPVDIDHDDSTPPVLTFTGDVITSGDATTFFARFTPDETFVQDVKKVSITVSDSRNMPSTVQTADLMTPCGNPAVQPCTVRKASGATCDARGFDLCPSGQVCAVTGEGTGGLCRTVSAARASACSSAPSLTLSTGTATVRSATGTTSLWNPAEGCSFGNGQPDKVVKLVLGAPATRLRLSTDYPYTVFDSELYVMRKCDDPPTLCDPRSTNTEPAWCVASEEFWCRADQAGGDPQAVLTLNNLAAGTYFVIVDSFPPSTSGAIGNDFQLSATVE